ncbi:ATP-dependent helicase [Psittacicella hinzii]|uniref:DNA 3'-5' helicase n=1 Tax=Psittacicella hinzii TaxID=2028575 RepID=A0A3A1YTC8_9GAMM|nr:ATP-dependent helicase [Psittacicella hinzii]RIY40468.1 hypothetical protein CKF58_00510 [Psittacicella hinzii]
MALNHQQLAYVQSPLENSLVLAGAGTGKTTSFIERLAYLMNQGLVNPFNIFATSFTNAAANEIKLRLLRKLQETNPLITEQQVNQCYLGTFHSLFGRILRNNVKLLGDNDIRPNFTNLDESTAASKIGQFIKNRNLKEFFEKQGLSKNKDILGLINTLRESYFSEQISMHNFMTVYLRKVKSMVADEGESQDSFLQRVDQSNAQEVYKNFLVIYQDYADYKALNNVVDFTDYLVKTYFLLKNNPTLLARYQHQFRYIIVDECQDINLIQYKLIELLHNPALNYVSMIGDDDQAIYGFRGSCSELIENFQEQFNDVVTYKLELNYRCAPNIINLANQIINLNKTKNIKTLIPAKAQSENRKVEYLTLFKPDSCYQAIANDLLKHKDFKGSAILARTNSSLKMLEMTLINNEIPYEFKASIEFFDRLEIKYVLSVLSVALLEDNISFEYCLNNLVKNVGSKSIELIMQQSAAQGISMYRMAREQIDAIWKSKNTLGRKNLEQFFERIEQVRQACYNSSLEDVFARIIEIFDLDEYFKAKNDNYEGRMENLARLIEVGKNFIPQLIDDQQTQDNDKENLRQIHTGSLSDAQVGNLFIHLVFLRQFFLDTSSLNDKGEDDVGKVTLSTIHRAKGLEWNNVYLVDFNSRTMPSEMSQTREELAEERRLFYVAITRAKEKLQLYYSTQAYAYNSFLDHVEPSEYSYEFLDKKLKDSLNIYIETRGARPGFELLDIETQRVKELKPAQYPVSLASAKGINQRSKINNHGLTSSYSKSYSTNSKASAFDPYSRASTKESSSRGMGFGGTYNKAGVGSSFGSSYGAKTGNKHYGNSYSDYDHEYSSRDAMPESVKSTNSQAKALAYTKKWLEQAASSQALNLPVVQNNLGDFAELAQTYELTDISEFMNLPLSCLAVKPALNKLIPQFAHEIEQAANLSLGRLIFACGFAELDSFVRCEKLSLFFKSAKNIFAYIGKFSVKQEYCEYFAQKHNVPVDYSAPLYQVFKEETNQDKLISLMATGLGKNNRNPDDQKLVDSYLSMKPHDEFLTRVTAKRDQFLAQQNAQASSEFLDKSVFPFVEQNKPLTNIDLDLIDQQFVNRSVADSGEQLLAQHITKQNLHQYTVMIIGQHSFLTRDELLEELAQTKARELNNINVAQIVFVIGNDFTQSEKYQLEIAQQRDDVILLNEQDWERIFA